MAKMYAYSDIHHDGGTVKRGEEVTQAAVGASDEDWEVWQQDKVVGESKLPEDLKSTESLTEYYKRKAAEQMAAVEAGDFSSVAEAEAEPIGKTEAKEVKGS